MQQPSGKISYRDGTAFNDFLFPLVMCNNHCILWSPKKKQITYGQAGACNQTSKAEVLSMRAVKIIA